MVFKELSLDGKVAIVTGAGRGLGKGIALTMAEAGADIVCVSRTSSEIEKVMDEINGLGRKALAISTDITDSKQVEDMVSSVLNAWGHVDILVNNAGALISKPIDPLPGDLSFLSPVGGYNAVNEATTEEEWNTVIETNITGPFICCRAVGSHMIERNKGKIINISSVAAAKGRPMLISYAASKAALNNFTKALASEWSDFNINVNAIGPANFPTQMNLPLHENEEARQRTISKVPLHRFGVMRELGILAVYLASDASDYMTGQCIYLDGGGLLL